MPQKFSGRSQVDQWKCHRTINRIPVPWSTEKRLLLQLAYRGNQKFTILLEELQWINGSYGKNFVRSIILLRADCLNWTCRKWQITISKTFCWSYWLCLLSNWLSSTPQPELVENTAQWKDPRLECLTSSSDRAYQLRKILTLVWRQPGPVTNESWEGFGWDAFLAHFLASFIRNDG